MDAASDSSAQRASERVAHDGSTAEPSLAENSVAVDESPEEVAIEHDIAALLAERDQFKDIALRLQADFENYRKRQQREITEEVDRRTGRLVESLLPVLDACEAAFSHGAEGVEPIWSALIGVLQKHGLEALDCADKPFDPAEADAVVHEPGDSAEPVVAEVLRTGYRWQGKVLRPAMVKVRG
jgi:molecular chaperone GrpE